MISFTRTAPGHRLRYVDDTWVKIKTQEVEGFTENINAVDSNIKFTQEDVGGNSLAFPVCAVHTEDDRSLDIEVYRKPTHRDQYLLFDSHHPLKHKLGVITTQHHQAHNMPTRTERKETRNKNSSWKHLPKLSLCQNHNTTKNKTTTYNTVLPYSAGVSAKLA